MTDHNKDCDLDRGALRASIALLSERLATRGVQIDNLLKLEGEMDAIRNDLQTAKFGLQTLNTIQETQAKVQDAQRKDRVLLWCAFLGPVLTILLMHWWK